MNAIEFLNGFSDLWGLLAIIPSYLRYFMLAILGIAIIRACFDIVL